MTLPYALRKLARAPIFTAVSLLTLAIGIGANAAIFSVVHGVLLKPLPFDEPERMVGIWHQAPALGYDLINQSAALYFTYREEGRVFEDVGLWDNTQVSVTGLEEPEQVDAMRVSDGIFPILRVRPGLGRLFTAKDDTAGAPKTVVLSHAYWQRRFGADPDVLGRTLRIDGEPREIIGVTPASLRFLRFEPALYLPFQFDRAEVFMGNFSYQSLARLKPGATIEQAHADVERMIPIAVEKFPKGITIANLREAQFGPRVRPLREDVVGDVGKVLWVLLGTVGVVLLIACANVANLFLVRAENRQQELAVRAALGAERNHLAGELILESVTLALMAGAAGLALAYAGIRVLTVAGPESLPRLAEISIDSTVLIFTFAIAVFSGLLLSLLPILKVGGLNLVSALKEGGRGTSDGRERHRARKALVVSQIALALTLLVGSGLMIRSFQALNRVHPGFERPEGVMTLRIFVPEAEESDVERAVRVHQTIANRLEAIPGVESVGVSSSITMDGWDSNDGLEVEGFPMPEDQIPPIRRFKWISEKYFETMGNPLLAGRTITWSDVYNHRPVVMVTENLAREYWGEPAAAVGKRVRQYRGKVWREIVGVVGNVHDEGVGEKAVPVVYWPMLVSDFWEEEQELFGRRSIAYAIRTTRAGSSSLLREAEQAVWSVNPNLPLANVRTLEEILDRSMARTSFTLVMLAIAAAVALLLGAVGIYGVISYVVSTRTQEIGVRMTLGAEPRDVVRLVLREGLVLSSAGVGLGIVATVGLSRLMSALLFGVSPADPMTYSAVSVSLTGVAIVASYLPARKAASVDPTEALRWE